MALIEGGKYETNGVWSCDEKCCLYSFAVFALSTAHHAKVNIIQIKN